ncbi:MAG: penicillin-binding protein 2 [Anaerolineae bacterium]|mgnify:CR=1 FL=1|jgi:penicillin-binding protein 2|nr:penicillin-binding protein 2 [Anaerolineae bacterium]MBT7070235.1 penicillin-binding protein 2 [Anaerolineae bacterium]MBT7324966.1 penicillin-binding protein 2 [Anaerolineae bacterium]
MSTNSPSGFRTEPWRVLIFYIAAALVFSMLIFRLFNLQVLEGGNWLVSAEDNYTREISVPSSRGIIYDRNGVILARNVASYNVVITPAYLPDDQADIERVYRELSEIIAVPVNSGTVDDAKLFAACVPGPGIAQLVELGDSLAPYTPVPVSCDVDEKTARIVRERSVGWPGVSMQIDPIRDYPTGSLTANIIGFLGPIPATQVDLYEELGFVAGRDKIGYAGVESTLQDILAGTNGKRVIEVDVAGQELRNLEAPIEPVAGRNVRLSIDVRLQRAAEGVLLNEIEGWNAYFGQVRISSGVTIAMNPKTGEILAMVSYPTYENNRFARFIPAYYYQQLSEDSRNPLLNNAISSEYPPGSVFKLSTATGALNEGVVTVDQTIYAPGQLILTEKFSPNDPGRERPFVDWIYDEQPEGFGEINFLRCIAFSSNVCFYKLGGGYEDEIPEGLGILRLGEYARALGYGEPSGIELPGETDGLIPSPQWKRINQGENWSTGDTYIASVGQGYVLATPLQVLMSGATIANDGGLMQPTVVREELDDEGRLLKPFEPHLKWDITETPLITNFDCDGGYCIEMETKSAVDPFVVEQVQTGMRLAVTDTLHGTLNKIFGDFPIAVAGKTGTAEYCDDVALAANRCTFGNWPTHSWTLAYAPFEDPEIVIMAFMYNGGEGASVAGPVVGRVMEAYFELKAIDLAEGGGN